MSETDRVRVAVLYVTKVFQGNVDLTSVQTISGQSAHVSMEKIRNPFLGVAARSEEAEQALQTANEEPARQDGAALPAILHFIDLKLQGIVQRQWPRRNPARRR